VAGANAAAALRGRAPRRYRQPFHLTCLDLGDAGALVTAGFARDDVRTTGAPATRVKRYINRVLIYPPQNGDRDALLRHGPRPIPGRILASSLDAALGWRPLRELALARVPEHPDTGAASAASGR
jgi:hypothetical protein